MEKTIEEAKQAVRMMEQIDKFRAVIGSLQEFGDANSIFAEYGRKYCKILRGNVVHCFVDLSNGDILKAATWSAPAKHARGNIFASDCGRSAITQYGAVYLN